MRTIYQKLQLPTDITPKMLLESTINDNVLKLTPAQRETVEQLRELFAEMFKPQKDYIINNVADAAAFLCDSIRGLTHEECHIVFLNVANKVIHHEMLYKGDDSSTTFNIKEIIAKALSWHAYGIIVYHNHPSGSVFPSKTDIERTSELQKASDVFGIKLFDHIIISKNSYFAFSEEKETKL